MKLKTRYVVDLLCNSDVCERESHEKTIPLKLKAAQRELKEFRTLYPQSTYLLRAVPGRVVKNWVRL